MSFKLDAAEHLLSSTSSSSSSPFPLPQTVPPSTLSLPLSDPHAFSGSPLNPLQLDDLLVKVNALAQLFRRAPDGAIPPPPQNVDRPRAQQVEKFKAQGNVSRALILPALSILCNEDWFSHCKSDAEPFPSSLRNLDSYRTSSRQSSLQARSSSTRSPSRSPLSACPGRPASSSERNSACCFATVQLRMEPSTTCVFLRFHFDPPTGARLCLSVLTSPSYRHPLLFSGVSGRRVCWTPERSSPSSDHGARGTFEQPSASHVFLFLFHSNER